MTLIDDQFDSSVEAEFRDHFKEAEKAVVNQYAFERPRLTMNVGGQVDRMIGTHHIVFPVFQRKDTTIEMVRRAKQSPDTSREGVKVIVPYVGNVKFLEIFLAQVGRTEVPFNEDATYKDNKVEFFYHCKLDETAPDALQEMKLAIVRRMKEIMTASTEFNDRHAPRLEEYEAAFGKVVEQEVEKAQQREDGINALGNELGNLLRM